MAAFCPTPWPEDPVPQSERGCRDCGLYQHDTRMIWGEGNPDAPIFVILDNPGAREDRHGNSFVCRTRQTLQQSANDAGISMDDLYVTFILKRKPVKAYEKEETRSVCIRHLETQLREKEPSLVLCLGNVAVQSFFHSDKIDVKSSRGKVHNVSGYKTLTAYHPLAVRRRPNLRKLFQDDWNRLARYYQASL